MEQVEILVVGGGIGGLSAALTVAETGRHVHVLEASPQLGEIGAGIQLGPNATRSLATLGLLEEVTGSAIRPRELVYMDAHTGARITSLDCGEPMIERYGFPYMVVHRGDLHRVLLRSCEGHPLITLETDRQVVGVEPLTPGAAAWCENGARYEARALIGTDGLHSAVRAVVSDDEPVASRYVAYRGAVPFSEVPEHAEADSMVMWVGDSLHMAQYKLRGGTLYNQVGVFRSRRFGLSDDWGGPDELDEHFGGCCDTLRNCASLLNRDQRWPMYDRDPIGNWTCGEITLVGDAAHPMLQYLAQGGCQALEDALALGRHLGEHTDVGTAFLAYQAERIPRTARVQLTARRFGEVSHLGGIAGEVRNALFGQHAPRDYTPFDWLYAERPVLAVS